MSKKLLSEAQVRRFQSLASIKPLNEMYDDEASMKEEEIMEQEDEAMADEAPEADVDMNDEAPEADVEIDEELVEKFMDAVGTIQQVADALGGEAPEMNDEEFSLEDEEEAPMPIGDEEEGGEEPMELDAGEDAEEKEDEDALMAEALRGIDYVPSQKEIVKTVAKRVARRLQEAKRAEARLNRALGKK